MKKFKHTLPPLDCLVFFEAAARLMNFSAAAKELFVSQAAVSKRIKQLEDWMGTPLFIRQGRHLLLTGKGNSLLEKVSMTLEFIETAIQPAVNPYPNSVYLSANSAVSMFWLLPRLKAFSLSEDSCEVRLTTTDEPAAQLSAETDLAILYCDGHISDWTCELLVRSDLAPIATVDYLAQRGLCASSELQQLFASPDVVLLNYKRYGPESIHWENWLEMSGYQTGVKAKIQPCQTYAHSIGSALEHKGIALGATHLLQTEIDSGQLVVLGDTPLVTPRDYYLCHPNNKQLSMQARLLQGFLRARPGKGDEISPAEILMNHSD